MCSNIVFNPKRAAGLGLLIVLGTASLPGMACAVLSKEQAERARQVAVQEARTAAKTLYAQADQVFVAQLSKFSSSFAEGHREAAGASRLEQFQVRFQSVDNIKGEVAPGQDLEYAIDRSRVVVGCSIPFNEARIRASQVGEQFLVYAREGRILRAVLVPVPYEAIDAREEAALLRGLRE